MIYSHLIENMRWSYSRLKAFEDCPYKWYLKYLKDTDVEEMFFANYGKFMHQLIEEFYMGNSSREELVLKYLLEFRSVVKGTPPNTKIFTNYFQDGLNYLKNMTKLDYEPLGVEKEVLFKVDDYDFIGFIDFVGTLDNEIYIVDNKSRNLAKRSQKTKKTKKNMELDEYLKQLYLYSIPIKQQFGSYPKWLCFNCFRTNTFIKEPFIESELENTVKWAVDLIHKISNEEDFNPELEYFPCRYICDLNESCEYYELWNRK